MKLNKTYLNMAVAGLFAASLSASVLAETPKTKRHHFALKSKAQDVTAQGASMEGGASAQIPLTAEITEGRMTLMDEIWDTNFVVPPHFHKTHAEVFYILDGQVEWTVGGETHVMSAGDTVYIPPNTVHSVRVVGDKKVHTLMIYEPGGYEESVNRRAMYTEEQLRDPKIREELNRANDFYMAQ